MSDSRTTIEYAVRYTERSSFNGREYVAIEPIGSSPDAEAAIAADERAQRTREYQAREGLPVDAEAVWCTITITPWEPILPNQGGSQ